MNNSEFDELLRKAGSPGSLPPAFRHEVWRRIESDASASVPHRFAWLSGIFPAFHRPWVGFASVTALVALGLWLGSTSGPQPRDAKVAYAESISPFLQHHRK